MPKEGGPNCRSVLALHRQFGHSVRVGEPVDLGPTGGAVWANPAEWARRRSPEGCIICASGAPLDIVAEFSSSWATVPRRAPLPGYVCVVARQHVNEPYEMDGTTQAQFWQETMTVAEAVARVVRPIKMNYEIHGNTLPHLHVHLFPRQVDDPFVGGPVDPRAVEIFRSDEQIQRLSDAICSAQQR